VTRRRLDAELVRRGLCTGRAGAREAIEAGMVQVGGIVISKAASMVAEDAPIVLVGSPQPYVSRAGGKLAAALDRFGVDPAGRRCLDAGASTGGFTDVLLRRGARDVCAVDVGYGQLAWSIRNDPRVAVLERTNVRALPSEAGPFDLVVADLSFISLRTVMGSLRAVATTTADGVVLVKPQFEVGRGALGKGGVVRDPVAWRSAIDGVVETGEAVGWHLWGAMASPLPGPAGNVEFLLHLAPAPAADVDLPAVIAEGEALRP
jgi:23S rRNA (cytidine1920-2'-O)/16S rRNA (cytidine1409-2'-O)-methyltransferase